MTGYIPLPVVTGPSVD